MFSGGYPVLSGRDPVINLWLSGADIPVVVLWLPSMPCQHLRVYMKGGVKPCICRLYSESGKLKH